ncbi:hypothetical protein GW17_00061015, partial [Ensete ventricosum]
GVRKKKTETRRKIVEGSQNTCQELGSSDDVVGNSPGVRQELTEGIGNLPRWRKGVHRKKTETRQKIGVSSRKACRELGRS